MAAPRPVAAVVVVLVLISAEAMPPLTKEATAVPKAATKAMNEMSLTLPSELTADSRFWPWVTSALSVPRADSSAALAVLRFSMLSTVTIIDDSSPGSSATVCAVGRVRYRALLPNVVPESKRPATVNVWSLMVNVEPMARLIFSARVVPRRALADSAV
ncbi:hypothetical protein AHiyo4_12770 [Arthrobacter sp. Hiyo4]|nr:hypothetical protein AHiyo4_12770 [Arthrobacter sp. Hiyo4]